MARSTGEFMSDTKPMYGPFICSVKVLMASDDGTVAEVTVDEGPGVPADFEAIKRALEVANAQVAENVDVDLKPMSKEQFWNHVIFEKYGRQIDEETGEDITFAVPGGLEFDPIPEKSDGS